MEDDEETHAVTKGKGNGKGDKKEKFKNTQEDQRRSPLQNRKSLLTLGAMRVAKRGQSRQSTSEVLKEPALTRQKLERVARSIASIARWRASMWFNCLLENMRDSQLASFGTQSC